MSQAAAMQAVLSFLAVLAAYFLGRASIRDKVAAEWARIDEEWEALDKAWKQLYRARRGT